MTQTNGENLYRTGTTYEAPKPAQPTQPVNEVVAEYVSAGKVKWLKDGCMQSGTKLYTSPPSAQMLVDAIEYYLNECSGYEPSLSVAQIKFEQALEAYKKGK